MKRLIGFLFSILIITGVFLIPVIPVLSISSRKDITKRFYSTSAYKNGFVISYTHSVNKGRVHDVYFITDDNKLKLDKTIFVSYGAGIPEPEETPGAEFKVLENGYEISNLNRVVPKLTMAVGIIANHSLTLHKHNSDFEYSFTDFFEPQTSIILQIKKISLLEYIFHKI